MYEMATAQLNYSENDIAACQTHQMIHETFRIQIVQLAQENIYESCCR